MTSSVYQWSKFYQIKSSHSHVAPRWNRISKLNCNLILSYSFNDSKLIFLDYDVITAFSISGKYLTCNCIDHNTVMLHLFEIVSKSLASIWHLRVSIMKIVRFKWMIKKEIYLYSRWRSRPLNLRVAKQHDFPEAWWKLLAIEKCTWFQ